MLTIKKIGVIGAGQMGRGIAQVGAMTGFEVIMYDVSAEGLKKGHEFIATQLQKGQEKGKWDQTFVQNTL